MKVLIVEDEFLVADFIGTVLLKNNHEIVGMADDLESAITALAEFPEVCLVDIHLAKNNCGIDFGIILNEKKIPFVYITANNDIATKKRAKDSNPIAYLSKPFNVKDLLSVLVQLENNVTID